MSATRELAVYLSTLTLTDEFGAGFVHVFRLLIEILQIQQLSFVLENSQRALQDIEEALHVLQPTEKMLQTVSEVRQYYMWKKLSLISTKTL